MVSGLVDGRRSGGGVQLGALAGQHQCRWFLSCFFSRGSESVPPCAALPAARRDRAGLLAQLEAPPLILHTAEAEGKKLPYEVGGRAGQGGGAGSGLGRSPWLDALGMVFRVLK